MYFMGLELIVQLLSLHNPNYDPNAILPAKEQYAIVREYQAPADSTKKDSLAQKLYIEGIEKQLMAKGNIAAITGKVLDENVETVDINKNGRYFGSVSFIDKSFGKIYIVAVTKDSKNKIYFLDSFGRVKKTINTSGLRFTEMYEPTEAYLRFTQNNVQSNGYKILNPDPQAQEECELIVNKLLNDI